jgi:arginyl-tRNA synthetase
VQKADGGYLYATTDLAAIRYRLGTLGADRVIYVVDNRQQLHFRQLIDVAKKAGWVPADRDVLAHAGFGMMMTREEHTDDDGKVSVKTVPFKTRTGGTIKLVALLDEAEQRAGRLFEKLQQDRRERMGENAPELSPDEKTEIARVVGIGSVKYNDLGHERTTDYVFDWDKMISMEGNTAAYMINAYVRVHGIGRKGGIDYATLDTQSEIQLDHDAEIALAKQLLALADTVSKVADDLTPHLLCNYLYETARAFSAFYRDCQVLGAETAAARTSRLRLCDLTARTLKLGLGLLGIEVMEKM